MAQPGCETSSDETWALRSPWLWTRRAQSRSSQGAVATTTTAAAPTSFVTYFPRVLKQVHKGLSLPQKAVSVMDSFIKDIFERIADKASLLAHSTKHTTIISREIQTAVRLLLPGEISKFAKSETSKAIIRYTFCQ